MLGTEKGMVGTVGLDCSDLVAHSFDRSFEGEFSSQMD